MFSHPIYQKVLLVLLLRYIKCSTTSPPCSPSFWFKSPSSLIRTMVIAFSLMSSLLPFVLFTADGVILLKSKSAHATPLLKTLLQFPFLEQMPRFLLLPIWPHMIWLWITSLASSPTTPPVPLVHSRPGTLVSVLFLEHTSSLGHCTLYCSGQYVLLLYILLVHSLTYFRSLLKCFLCSKILLSHPI